MGAAAKYAYLHSRVSTMSTRLLSDAYLQTLIESAPAQENDIFQASALIGLSPDEPTAPPYTLEQRLVTLLLADFLILTRSLSGAAREFFVYWAYRFELSNLKAILRGKMTGQPAASIRDQLVDMGPFSRLPIDELLLTEDVTELLRRLETTPFADIARQARRIFEEHHEPFALDAALDRRYFAGLSKRARDIESGEARLLRPLVGSIIDRLNLQWLLRYRFAYDLPPAETYYLLIPANYLLSRQQLAALSQLGSLEEALRHLPPPFAALLEGATTISEVARILERESWRLARSTLRHTAFNLARTYAYLLLREKDLRQMRAILKGRRLKMGPDLIRQAVGTLAAAG